MIGRRIVCSLGKATSTWERSWEEDVKATSESKTLIVREGGGGGYIFSIVFIANLQGLKDIFGGPAFGGEVLDVGIDGGDGSDSGSGGCGGGECFGVPDMLGVIISLGFSLCLRGSTFICTVSLFATSEAKSFPNAASLISRRELFQADGVHIHGIWVSGGV